jgi:hypothetical protein
VQRLKRGTGVKQANRHPTSISAARVTALAGSARTRAGGVTAGPRQRGRGARSTNYPMAFMELPPDSGRASLASASGY